MLEGEVTLFIEETVEGHHSFILTTLQLSMKTICENCESLRNKTSCSEPSLKCLSGS